MMTINTVGNLVLLSEKNHPITIDLAYAGSNNFTGKSIYKNDLCYLHMLAVTTLPASQFIKTTSAICISMHWNAC